MVTELGCLPVLFPADGDPAKVLSTFGKAAPPFEAAARGLGSGAAAVGPGRPGELWLKPVGTFLGYYKDKAATEERCKDGWIATGYPSSLPAV